VTSQPLYFQFPRTERCVVKFNKTNFIRARNPPTVLHGRWKKRMTSYDVYRR